MYKLYGDGIHDDTAAIQERIDSGVCEVRLPMPERFYVISKSLELPSNFRLMLPRYAEIRLADGSNCAMVRNKVVYDRAERLPQYAHIFNFVDDFSPDAPCANIELCGGIWNCNNQGQIPNPLYPPRDESVREWWGYGMLFYNVTNLTLRDLTVKDPSNFGVTLDRVSYFTVENIVFDYNLGNPVPLNMDGIHLDGNCHYGTIRNLKGTCYDDLVALNADEGSHGPITNIEIDGIYAENCHSAVRLLTVRCRVEKIHISNVYGTYYQYCIGVTKFYPGETTGYFDAITLDHIYASKCMPVRKGEFQHPKRIEHTFPLIFVDGRTVVKSLTVKALHRREDTLPRDTVHVGREATVDRLLIDDVTTTNATGLPMPLVRNRGAIRYLSLRRIDCGADDRIVNEDGGTIAVIDD